MCGSTTQRKRRRALSRSGNTQLDGRLPHARGFWGGLRALEELSLSDNRFDGALPPALALLTNLSTLNLANNRCALPRPTGRLNATSSHSLHFESPPRFLSMFECLHLPVSNQRHLPPP